MVGDPAQDTDNIQQYSIEHRRKWEERYYILEVYINVFYVCVLVVPTHTSSLMMMELALHLLVSSSLQMVI